jgi:DNA invertase Pin-like site-specific DNA recombinase
MKVLYTRVSSVDQKTDRQRINEKDFDLVIEDKCSGSIPYFERGGNEVLKYVSNGLLTSLSVWTIDRLGRDLRDIMNTIHFFNEKLIPIHFISQGLTTLDENGHENAIAKMMISVLGTVGEMQRSQIRENQKQGIVIAKLKGVYLGRKEDTLQFLSKPKNKKALDYLKKGYKAVEVSKLTDLNINTITKIKKLGLVLL